MEQELLYFIGIFIGGLVSGVILMLILNKLTSGAASPKNLKQEYDDYQEKVESHFEETSKKFQEMTEQYQGLYKHLSVGATSLCRPESVAATLADQSSENVKLEKKEEPIVEVQTTPVDDKPQEPSLEKGDVDNVDTPVKNEATDTKVDNKSA